MRNFSFENFLTGLLAMALIVGWPVSSRAALSVPPSVQNAPEARIEQYNQTRAAVSLSDKVHAGKDRFEQRVAFKALLARGMQVQAEERRSQFAKQSVVLPSHAASDSGRWGILMSSAVLVIVLLLALRMRWSPG